MITEDRKYQSDVFKISGFALMTPFGKFVLDILSLGLNITTWFYVNLLVSFALFLVGVIIIQKGYEAVTD